MSIPISFWVAALIREVQEQFVKSKRNKIDLELLRCIVLNVLTSKCIEMYARRIDPVTIDNVKAAVKQYIDGCSETYTSRGAKYI